MTKRSSDAALETVVKKMRPHPELEAMKSALDKLMSNANTHHEEARIAAIDKASDLEDKWVAAMTLRDSTQEEYDTVEEQCRTAVEYLNAFEASSVVNMLKKASASQLLVPTLINDHDKVQESLTDMERLCEQLEASRDSLLKTLNSQKAQCSELETEHKAAEKYVDTITNFK